MSEVLCMFRGESGRGHILTVHQTGRDLGGGGGGHEGATEGEDSQELQG